MKRTSKGMSMVEIMIGVMLLCLILVPSLNVMIGQTQTVTATRDHSQAAFLAQKIQEMAKACTFTMLDADKYNDEPDTQKKTFEWKLKNDEEYKTYVMNGITYNIDPEYTSIDPLAAIGAEESTVPSLYAFKFSITYVGKDNRNHHLNVSTILAQR